MTILYHDFEQGPSIMGSARYVKHSDGSIQYGGDLRGYFSGISSYVAPKVVEVLRDKTVQSKISNLLSQAVSRGAESLASSINGRGLELEKSAHPDPPAVGGSVKLSAKGQKKLDMLLGKGIKYLA